MMIDYKFEFFGSCINSLLAWYQQIMRKYNIKIAYLVDIRFLAHNAKNPGD